jgi:hypothetical protein
MLHLGFFKLLVYQNQHILIPKQLKEKIIIWLLRQLSSLSGQHTLGGTTTKIMIWQATPGILLE